MENSNNVIDQVKMQLVDAKKTRLTTGAIRKISAKNFQLIKDHHIDDVLNLCEQLLEERKWELGVVAYDWAFKMKKQYTEETFIIFESWLKKYVTDWGDCDDFCTHAFGELLSQYNHLFEKIVKWTEHPAFPVRRAAAVILIYPIKKGRLGDIDPYIIVEKLYNDDHYLVLKGYGWMLKVLSQYRPEEVYQYLLQNKQQMPRTAFRYALEKLEKDNKVILMQK